MDNNEQLVQKSGVLACRIQEPEQMRQRSQEIAVLFKSADQVLELTDGYAFNYPANPTWAHKLLEFVLFEKECCPFFTFDMIFEPQHGPLTLRIRGPEGAKEILRNAIMEAPT